MGARLTLVQDSFEELLRPGGVWDGKKRLGISRWRRPPSAKKAPHLNCLKVLIGRVAVTTALFDSRLNLSLLSGGGQAMSCRCGDQSCHGCTSPAIWIVTFPVRSPV